MFITIRLSKPLTLFERHHFFGYCGSGRNEVTFKAKDMSRKEYEDLSRGLYLSYQTGHLYGGNVQVIAIMQRLVNDEV